MRRWSQRTRAEFIGLRKRPMRPRRRFDAVCENPDCPYPREPFGLHFVVARKNRRKDGSFVTVLKCDCGRHHTLLPPGVKGLHQLSLNRAEQLQQQEAKAQDRLREMRLRGQPPPTEISVHAEMDASVGYGLYLVAKGRSLEEVARLWSISPKDTQ